MRWLRLLVPFLLVACAGGPPAGESPGAERVDGIEEPPPLAMWQTWLENPSRIRAGKIEVVLPRHLEGKIVVRGLSSGWRKEDGRLTWEGTGEAQLSVLSLELTAAHLKVVLPPPGRPPETLITAEDDVTYTHAVQGVVRYGEGLDVLLVRNEKSLER